VAGGIATIGLFGKYWSPRECLTFFQKFARNIFPSRIGVKQSICGMLRRIFAYYLQDGRYDAGLLDKTLREALGQSPIFDSVQGRPSGMKFAVTATTISDATVCLISNYNGRGSHSKALSEWDRLTLSARLTPQQGTSTYGRRGPLTRCCSGKRKLAFA
jgi:hypothetical protein